MAQPMAVAGGFWGETQNQPGPDIWTLQSCFLSGIDAYVCWWAARSVTGGGFGPADGTTGTVNAGRAGPLVAWQPDGGGLAMPTCGEAFNGPGIDDIDLRGVNGTW